MFLIAGNNKYIKKCCFEYIHTNICMVNIFGNSFFLYAFANIKVANTFEYSTERNYCVLFLTAHLFKLVRNLL